MNDNQRTELKNILKESVNFNVAMSSYTTFRVGGKAEAICVVNELSELTELVAFLDLAAIPWMVTGKGSNLLVTDKGLSGVVIILKGKLAEVHEENSNILVTGGGLSIARFLKYCVDHELSGLEFMSGIPGTLGGAVIMNAGVYGSEIGEQVLRVGVVDVRGRIGEIESSEISFAYRKTLIPKKTIVYSVTLRLKKDKKELIRKRIENNIDKRKKSQPLDMPSCGSVFKNPPGESAGRLIEMSGLKGKKIGDAMISLKHANFIVNTGMAKASDILELIGITKKKVREDTGIDLETEIKVVGL